MEWFLILLLLMLGYAFLEAFGIAVLQVAFMLLVRVAKMIGSEVIWLKQFIKTWRRAGWDEAVKSSQKVVVEPAENLPPTTAPSGSISDAGLPLRNVSEGFSAILITLMLLGFVGLGLYSVISFFRAKEERIRQAGIQVSQLAIRLAARVEKDEMPPSGELTESDLWGEPILADIQEFETRVTVTVTSKGPDRVRGTRDDVVRTQSVPRSLKEMARRAADQGAGKLLDKAKQFFRKDDANKKK